MSSCECQKCRDACTQNPGWFKPEEAHAAIMAGLADRMMRDWLEPDTRVGNDDRIYLLSPAAEGCEGTDAPEMDMDLVMFLISPVPFRKGRCVFFTRDQKCELHYTGFKPCECWLENPCDRDWITQHGLRLHFAVAKAWDTELGRAVVAEWEKAVGR